LPGLDREQEDANRIIGSSFGREGQGFAVRRPREGAKYVRDPVVSDGKILRTQLGLMVAGQSVHHENAAIAFRVVKAHERDPPPSGDQAGLKSSAGSLVSRTWAPVRMSLT